MINRSIITEFKPTILFLVKFIGIYLIANIVYGVAVTYYEPRPDPVTHQVAVQTALVLKLVGYAVDVQDSSRLPNTLMVYGGRAILAVYEGCNGINAMIVFASFIFAFGPYRRSTVGFVFLGFGIIHVANLTRITLLFFVARYLPSAMYFIHKFVFTGFIYVVIFGLWIWWVRKAAGSHDKSA